MIGAEPNRSPPPSGVVTYLFTDVEGSTERWDREADDMAVRLGRHDELSRACIDRHCGYVFSNAGDSFAAAFATPLDGLRAALDLQRALTAEQVLPVRMGVHVGESQQRDGNYFGTAVNRAARLAATAHGGQIVVSAAVRGLIADELPGHGAGLRRLGVFRLKDLSKEEEIWQLVASGLRDTFPPLRTLDVVRHNLPTQRTALVGRQAELAELDDALGAHPLTTLVGPGGIGKTRLALAVAAARVDRHQDGVWLVDLAPAGDGDAVTAALATAVRHRGGTAVGEMLDALARQEALLVFDNCEHVAEAVAATVTRLLDGGGPLRVLATSQLPLRVPGERLIRLGPLSFDTDEGDVDALILFEERARLVDPDFEVRPATRAVVADICRRLDGLPLAIEMAAANVEVMSVAEIAARLDDRFAVLVGATRSAARHETLRKAIEWSHGLLEPDAQVLLARLGAFAGTFTLPAAEQVCAAAPLVRGRVLPLLTELVRRSLVTRVDIGAGERGFRLLESVRAFAVDQLAAAGAGDALADALTAWCAAWATDLQAWHVPPTAATYQSIRANLDNVSVAVQRSLLAGDAETAHRIVLGLASSLGFLNLRLGLRWLEQLEQLAAATNFDDCYWARRRILARAQFEQLQGRYEELATRLNPLCQAEPADEIVLAARNLYANTVGPAMPEMARSLAEATRDAYLAIGDQRGAIEAEVTLSAIDLYDADHASTLERAAEFGIEHTMHGSFQVLCALLLARDHDALLARLDEMRRGHFTFMLDHQADLLRAAALATAGRCDEARESMRGVLRIVRRDGVPLCAEECVETLAFIAHEQGDPSRAAELLGAFRTSGPSPYRTPLAIGMYRLLRKALGTALGDAAFRDAWEAGRRLGVEGALRREVPEPTGRATTAKGAP